MLSFLKKSKPLRKPARTPDNTRIYAVGDIHGRFDLLQKLHQTILNDAKSAEVNTRKVIVYIGDYIDRGVESRQVIDSLLSNNLGNFESVFIKGNHEDAMLKFLDNAKIGELWLAWGGYATIQSYGINLNDGAGKRLSMEELRVALSAAVPPAHLHFLENLKINHTEGDYFFVHAGIKPHVELEKQSDEDMMTIREEFIYADYPSAEKTIVFGHTIFEESFSKTGKISIDTGAYATGKLTAVVLEGDSVRFLQN